MRWQGLPDPGAPAEARDQLEAARRAPSLHFVKLWRYSEVVFDPECPVCRTAEVIGGKWTLLIIRDLADSSLRFCELERSLKGISPRTLSLRLRALEEEGIVERRTYPEVPPRVEYALTDKGTALVPLIEDMRTYGSRWLPQDQREPAAATV
jgi:DNA-binding HxlR family transcriptional regulator